MNIRDQFASIQSAIEQACQSSGRTREEVKVIAVTKYVSVERAKEAIAAGIEHIGENREDGFLNKWDVLRDKPCWHFIGSLQSRKVKNIVDKVDYIHSLDRLSLAKEINKRMSKEIKCFVQVNTSGEASKHGLDSEQAIDFIKKLEAFKKIKVVGLMTMAPYTDNEEELRHCFRKLRQLSETIQQFNLSYAPCTELSMGMSNDYRLAIEEGATFVRIGTALVGNERVEEIK